MKKNRRLPAPKLCTRAAWKSVPFEGRRRWRKGAKRNSWGVAETIPGQPCQLVQTFRYVSRERWAPVLRIPCPFLGAVRLADLPCVWGVQLGDRRIVVVSDGSAHGGVQGHAVRGAFIQDATRERMRLALLGMHHSVLPSSHRMTDRHSPAGTALPGSAVFSARAPQIKQRKAAATKQDAGQQQNRPEAGRHQVPFQACMQRAIPVHETDRMQAGEYPQGRQPAQAAAEQQRAQDQGKEPAVAHGPGRCRAHAVFRRRDRFGNELPACGSDEFIKTRL